MGEKLFHDPQLSSDGTVVCASCHIVALGGDD
ncbi:cytochrome-c peroxidase, partial [Oleiphilus sp. HI0125]